MIRRIEISYKTILFILAVIAGIWFLNEIKEILLSLFISFVLMSALRPTVDSLEKKGLPRILVLFLIYVLIILILFAIGTMVIPVLVKESVRLIGLLPIYFDGAMRTLNLDTSFFSTQIAPASESVFKLTVGIFSNLLSFISLFVFTFYLLWERNHLKEVLTNFVGEDMGNRIFGIVLKTEKRLGGWVRGQFILCFIIGLMTYISLILLRIDYALPLAIVAGVLEMVPTIGPIISAIPAVIIGLATSPLLGLVLSALYFIIQQVENHLIVPNVMKKVTGLSPLLIIIALMIGGKMMGVLGVILAVPMVLVIQVLVQEFLAMKK